MIYVDIDLIFLIISLLFVKHFVADFYLQTNEHVYGKGLYGNSKGIEHSLHHLIGTFGCLLFFINWEFALVLATVDGVIHYHIDWAKININKHHNLTPADQKFWFWLGVDQLLHSLTYIWIGWVIF